MPGKKTNYIAYEIKKLEKYFRQLEQYLDDNPPDQAEDRIEQLESTRGNPIIKVIQTKENQIKLFKETLKELPAILENLNRLRAIVDGEAEDEVRGGQGVPGFMSKKNGTGEPYKPKKNKQVKVDEEFPDDPEETGTSHLGLPAPMEVEEVEAIPEEPIEPEEDDEDDEDPWEDEF